MPNFSGKVELKLSDHEKPFIYGKADLLRKLYGAYFDLEKPMRRHYDIASREEIFLGFVDESRWPLSPTVLG